MKLATSRNRRAVIPALVASAAMLNALPLMATDNSGSFTDRMKQWEDAMSQKFHDTFAGLRRESDGTSVSTASVDLREQRDSYILRLNLPIATCRKLTSRCAAARASHRRPASDEAGRYQEQVVALSGVAATRSRHRPQHVRWPHRRHGAEGDPVRRDGAAEPGASPMIGIAMSSREMEKAHAARHRSDIRPSRSATCNERRQRPDSWTRDAPRPRLVQSEGG